MRHLRPLATVALVCAMALTGCGGSSAPADKAPDLADALTVVEDAVEQQRYAQARRHLQELVATTEDARAAGDLDDDEADRVLAAAARLLTVLPAPAARQPSEPAPEGDEDADDEEAKQKEEGHKGNGGKGEDSDSSENDD